MARARAMLVVAVLLVAVLSLPCMGDVYPWPTMCRTSGDQNYQVIDYYCRYVDTSQATCHEGLAWCLKTRHNNVKLAHWHFVTNFNDTERADANRWWEWMYAVCTPSNRHLSATTSFNCHAYALSSRDNVWNVDPTVTLSNDFNLLTGCASPRVGDIVQYTANHTGVLSALGPTKVMSKFGAYGKYETGLAIPGFGGIDGYWRPKP